MALIEELKQYENVVFPNLDALQKSIKDILEAFRYLKELHIKVSDGSDDIWPLDELNRKFNTLVNMRAKESSKMSMDLEDFIEYFRMLTADNVTVNTLLQILLGLKDVAKIRINSSEKLLKEFGEFRMSIASRFDDDGGDDDGDDGGDNDDEVDHAKEKQSSKIIDGTQPPNFQSISYKMLEAIFFTGISYFLVHWVGPVEMWQFSMELIETLFNPSIQNPQSSKRTADLLQNYAPPLFSFVVFWGYCLVNREVLYRNRKNDTTIMDNERKQRKYKRNISTKLPGILKDLEILLQFWELQLAIFKSHINALQSMNGNINLRLPNRSMDGIIARCTKEKINCDECFQMLKMLL
ncbi:hypothetical protein Glove_346g112 [Diversispora epigaea]|uniref:Uncharacterized protein n=1 Tax=Diversispora epigaea TaxID=1348612 RepID=A0A397HMF7_9GLOM|nr:hypothetical protein Glove_346g112 [Diversispora epigaea]